MDFGVRSVLRFGSPEKCRVRGGVRGLGRQRHRFGLSQLGVLYTLTIANVHAFDISRVVRAGRNPSYIAQFFLRTVDSVNFFIYNN